MTALGGIWAWRAGRDAASNCARIMKSQARYGGREAAWHAGDVALARSLVQRLPEDRFDRGPVVGAGGRFVLVADVRLDNRRDLAAALGLAADEEARLSDSDVLMRCWERWGEEALQRLVGDFAFALWDERENRLQLARDFLGRRPLHYHHGAGFFAFASMPAGLHALPEVPYALSEERALDYLGNMHARGPASFFEGILRVEPGEIVTVARDALTRRSFWAPDLSPLRLPRREDYYEALREKLDGAVEARLRGASRAVASHLSAGLDSSSVSATAARLLRPSGGRVVAFTSVPSPGFESSVPRGRLADEGPLAAAVGRLYPNVEHVTVTVPDDASAVADLDRQFFLYQRPLLNVCNTIWLDAINDEAKRRGLNVMLTAELGNMSMSYNGEHRLSELLTSGSLLTLVREAAAQVRRGQRLRTVGASAFGPLFPQWLSAAVERWREGTSLIRRSAIRRSVLRDAAFRRRARERGVEEYFRHERTGLAARLKRLGTLDSGNLNKGVLAGWGIDIRDPTADRRLVEFCLRVPMAEFARDGRERVLAREAFADRLPPELLAEPRRGYQMADWPRLVGGSRDQVASLVERLAEHPFAREALDIERLRALLRDWPDEPAMAARRNDYRLALLRAASFGRFVEKATGSN